MKAKVSYLRISPRKVRLVADMIRGKSVKEADSILKFTVKKAKSPVVKLLNQAVANAVNNSQLDKSNLYISKITVDEGPKYRRLMPRSRGRDLSSTARLIASEIGMPVPWIQPSGTGSLCLMKEAMLRRTATSKLLRTSSRVIPPTTQPGSAGAYPTKPSSSGSMQTGTMKLGRGNRSDMLTTSNR